MKKKLIILILSVISAVCLAAGLTACDSISAYQESETSQTEQSAWENGVYTVQTAYAMAQELGYSGTLEEFIASIAGADGVGIADVSLNTDGELIITLTDNSYSNLGKLTVCTHSYGDWVTGAEATCTSIGYKYRTCSKCGYKDYVFTEASGHTYSDTVINYDNYSHMLQCTTCNQIITEAHTFVDNVCTVCGCNYYSEGLEFSVVYGDGGTVSYSVSAGTCTDSEVIIPAEYKGCPVTQIGSFTNYTALTSISIPDSVTTISGSAFYGCTSLTNIIIPDSVTSIGGYAFEYCSSLVSLTIPDGVTSIENCTFYGCASLKSINIPDGVTTIGGNAFEFCTSLKNITLPDSVTSIGRLAFSDCSSLENITIPDGVTTLENYTFENCTSLKTITFGTGSNLVSIGTYVFSGCTSLESIALPDEVTSIGRYAFENCAAQIVWGNNPAITEITSYAFASYAGTSLSIPDSVTTLNSYAFKDCTSLKTITFGTGSKLEYIGTSTNTFSSAYVFYGCTALENIEIPDSVTTIGSSAFESCTALKTVTFGSGSQLDTIGACAFYNCTALTSIAIPDSVITINSYAFGGCLSLADIYIGSGVTYLDIYSFYNCPSVTNISVSEVNAYYKSIDGNLYDYSGTTLIKYATGKTDTTFTIPSTVTCIYLQCFKDCLSLVSISMPNTVNTIYSEAFYGCTSLKTVDTYQVKSLKIIGGVTETSNDGAFAYCTSLESVTLPEVTMIGYCSFIGCTSLKSIVIPESVTYITDYAFNDCTSLESVYYMGSVSEWNGIWVYSDNTPLTEATMYYYSEEEPDYTDDYNYWYYDGDGNIITWSV